MLAAQVFLSADEIQSRVREMAADIDRDFGGEPISLVGVLRGCIHFYSDLARALESPTTVDFLQAMSYQGEHSTGEVQLVKDLSSSIKGRNVLLVEDIYDTGRTLDYLRNNLLNRHPKRLEIAALLRKPERHVVEVDVRYVGFSIPNKFVVGYGLDRDGEHRNLSYIGVLEP